MTETSELTTKAYELQRDNDLYLSFTGTELGRADSDKGRTRWLELAIYKTDSGRYVLQSVGRTRVSGEEDRFSADAFNTAVELVASMRHVEHQCPRCRWKSKQAWCNRCDIQMLPTDNLFFTDTALEVLETAAESDKDIDDAMVERA